MAMAWKKLPVTVSLKFFAMCESEVNDVTGKHQATLTFIGTDKALGEAKGEFETTEEKRATIVVRVPRRQRPWL